MQTREMRATTRPAESVRDVQDKDGSVLLDIEQGTCYSMNRVGSRIWEMLKTGSSIEQIVETLATEFEVPRQQLTADVTEFIDTLQKRNLLLTEPTSATDRRWSAIRAMLRNPLCLIKAWYGDLLKR